MLPQYGIRFYKAQYMTFNLASDLKKNTVYLSSYNPSILTNSMLRTYNSDIDERTILNKQVKFLDFFKELSQCSYKMIL